MSKRLLEAELPTTDLRSILNRVRTGAVEGTPVESDAHTSTAETTGGDSSGKSTDVPRAGGPETVGIDASKGNWKKELSKLSDHFNPKVIRQLEALGEYFVRSLKVLGYNIDKENGGNPILAFVAQKWVQDKLLNTGLLNINTFKAIYNAVAKNLVADSEFFKENDHNLIYCEALYKKTPAEIETYLTLQSRILKVSQRGAYSDTDVIKNKKVFLCIDGIKELDLVKRAEDIQGLENSDDRIVKSVKGAKLNSLKLAQQIVGESSGNTVSVSVDKQDKLVNALDNKAKIFAALMSLSVTTNNKKARKALSNELFRSLGAEAVAEATSWLIANNILPKGQLQDTDAATLVAKIIAKAATMR